MICKIESAGELAGKVNKAENLLVYFYSDDCALSQPEAKS